MENKQEKHHKKLWAPHAFFLSFSMSCHGVGVWRGWKKLVELFSGGNFAASDLTAVGTAQVTVDDSVNGPASHSLPFSIVATSAQAEWLSVLDDQYNFGNPGADELSEFAVDVSNPGTFTTLSQSPFALNQGKSGEITAVPTSGFNFMYVIQPGDRFLATFDATTGSLTESLPYGEMAHGVDHPGPGWGDTWIPLQLSKQDKRLEPRCCGQ